MSIGGIGGGSNSSSLAAMLGVGGIDVDGVVAKLMTLERQPLLGLEAGKAKLLAQQTAWRAVNSALLTFQGKADALRQMVTFNARQATAADGTIATVAADPGAAVGTHALNVQSLAQANVLGGGAFASSNAALNLSGSIGIGGQTIAVSAADTLATIAARINQNTAAGVTASVSNVGTTASPLYQLVLAATKSGTANAITLTDSAAAGTVTASSSSVAVLSATVLNSNTAAAGTYQVSVSQLATSQVLTSDAQAPGATFGGNFTINGVYISVAGGTNLNGLVTAINAAGAGVTAATNGTTLTLTANSTGAQSAIKVTDPGGLLTQLGILNTDLSNKHVTTAAQDASFAVNGKTYTSGHNAAVTEVLPGVQLDLAGTGSSTVTVSNAGGGVLRSLGFLNNNGAQAAVIAAAQDAVFIVDGTSFTRNSNTVSDGPAGTTITLNKLGATTYSVATDTPSIIGAVRAFADAYNAANKEIKSDLAYDSTTRKGGPLLGDAALQAVQNSLRRTITGVVSGLPATMNQLSQIGITTGAWNTLQQDQLVVDGTKLTKALQDNLTGVAQLFGAMRLDVAGAGNGGAAIASTTAAGAYNAADVIAGNTGQIPFGTPGGGWQSAAAPSTTTPDVFTVNFGSAQSIDAVVLRLPDTTALPAATTGIRDFTLQYLDKNGVWQDLQSVTGNTAGSRTLVFPPVTTSSIRLQITGTNGSGNPSRLVSITALQHSQGVASQVYTQTGSAVQPTTGTIATNDDSLTSQIKLMDARIKDLTDRLAARQDALHWQYAGLQVTLTRLRTMGNAIQHQLTSLGMA